MRKIRLFIAQENLGNQSLVKIQNQDFQYLTKVMRCKINDEITVFNGLDGDFLAQIINISKKDLEVKILRKIRDQETPNNITLAFAPVKNVRIDFIAQKAMEVGLSRFQPIITRHTIVDKINQNRFKSNIKEACEQCESNFIAEILPIQKLDKLLKSDFIKDKILILCNESEKTKKALDILPKIIKSRQENQEIVIFIGPEGGFSKEEFAAFEKLENCTSISLGSRILRSDTAIISALTLVNNLF